MTVERAAGLGLYVRAKKPQWSHGHMTVERLVWWPSAFH